MAVELKTTGEQAFEQYLISQGINDFVFEKTHEGKTKKPDYSVSIDKEYLFEVKDFVLRSTKQWLNYCSVKDVRDKIDEGCKKFREFKEYPCCLVLYDDTPLEFLEDAIRMYSAMYGEYEATPDTVSTDSPRYVFNGKGKMIRPIWAGVQNTTISALITLRYVPVGKKRLDNYLYYFSRGQSDESPIKLNQINQLERHLGVIVYENVFARIPFPRNIFCGKYDERYGFDESLVRVFAGSGVLTCEELEKVWLQSA